MAVQHLFVGKLHHSFHRVNVASLGFVGVGVCRYRVLDCRDNLLPGHHTNRQSMIDHVHRVLADKIRKSLFVRKQRLKRFDCDVSMFLARRPSGSEIY